MTAPTTHSFTVLLTGADPSDPDSADALYEAGCDDATVGIRDDIGFADFAREAATFEDALTSALEDIATALPDAEIVRVEPDQLVSLAQIAERSGLTREYIRLLAKGKRGPGGFPAPLFKLDRKNRFWEWDEVARWLTDNAQPRHLLDAEGAELIAAFNAALELRRRSRQLSKSQLALVSEALGKRL
jgi:hypothetical protein